MMVNRQRVDSMASHALEISHEGSNGEVAAEPNRTKLIVDQIRDKSIQVLEYLRDEAVKRRDGVDGVPKFSITQAADLVGRTSSAIKAAEKDGRLADNPRTASGRRQGYTSSELNNMRELFGTKPWRHPDDPAAVIAVQNFKGGVAKSTISAHLAQYLAIHGYRTLLIDCDSQASSTSLFGFVPDLDLTSADTLYPYFREGDVAFLKRSIRHTHFDGLDLIPANLELYSAEYEMAARLGRSQTSALDMLNVGIRRISKDYDVIILDPPPALGAISLSVMRAANALLVPVPPTLMDFSSTASFFSMLSDTITTLENHGMPVDLTWIRMVLSKANEQKSTQSRIMALSKSTYGENLCRAILRDSAEIDHASSCMMTVYELDHPSASHETFMRCKNQFNAVNRELEMLIRQQWPSHADRLAAESAV
jgi:chromosome partitioning protein